MATPTTSKASGCISHTKFSTKEITLLEQRVTDLRNENEFDDPNHAYIEAAAQLASEHRAHRDNILGALKKADAAAAPARPLVVVSAGGDVVAGTKKALGRQLTAPEKAVVAKLASLNARDAAIVRDALGWDEEHDQVEALLTYEQIGAKYPARGKDGAPMDRAGVQAVLAKVGLDKRVLDAVRAADTQSVTEADLELSNEGGATGFRVTDKPGAGADDFVLDAKTAKAQAATAGAIATADPAALKKVEAKLANKQAWKDGEFEQKRAAVAAAEKARMEAEPAVPQTVYDILAPDFARNDMVHNDVARATEHWNEEKLGSDPGFESLSPVIQAAVVRSYRNGLLTAERQGSLIDEHNDALIDEHNDALIDEHNDAQKSAGQRGASAEGNRSAGSSQLATEGSPARLDAPGHQAQSGAGEASNSAQDEVAPDDRGTVREARGAVNPDSGGPVLDLAAFTGAKNARVLLNTYLANAKDAALRTLASTLLRASSIGDVKVQWAGKGDQLPARVAAAFNGGAGAVAHTTGDKVTLYFRSDAPTFFREDIVVHEVIHALTEASLQRSPARAAELSALAKSVQFALNDTHGASGSLSEFWRAAVNENPGELLAYGLTSPTFRELFSKYAADGRPFSDYRTGPASEALRTGAKPASLSAKAPRGLSLWQRAVDFFSGLVGMPKAFATRFNAALDAYTQDKARFDAAETAHSQLMPFQGKLEAALHQLLAKTEAGGVTLAPKATDTISAAAATTGAKITDFRERLKAAAPAPAKSAFTNISDAFARVAPWLLTSFQIAQQWGSKIATLQPMVDLQDAMKVARTTMSQRAHAIAVQADKLAPAVKTQLKAVMQLATMSEAHPDLLFNDKLNAHLASTDAAVNAAHERDHAALAAKYDALPKDARDAYQAIKAELEAQWKARNAAMKQLVDDTYSETIRKANEAGKYTLAAEKALEGKKFEQDVDKQLSEMKGPYFPLMRFGEYLAVGESPEFKAAKDALAQAKGEARAPLQKALDKLKRDPKHYEVSAHDTRAGQVSAVAALKARGGLDVRADMGDQRVDNMRAVSADTLEHLTDSIDQQFEPGIAAKVNAALQDVFLRSLPENSALGREAARKGVAGASADMLRAYATTSEQNAFHTSRLLYAKKMADNLFQMKKEVKGQGDLQHIHREMEQRMALDMKYKPTPVQDVINSVSWAYHLGVSPSFMFINSTQPFLVAGPVLAGKFGLHKAAKALGQASRDSMAVLKAARWVDGKWDAWSGITEDSIPTTGRTAQGAAEDRKAVRALMQRGILDEGAQHELNMFSDDSSRGLAKVNRVMGWATQQIEMVNRMTTALASFRLARESGQTYDAALTYAYESTLETQMDYSGEGTARFMREGGGIPMAKLIFQFRRYQQSMLYLMGDNIKKSFGTGADAKQARATLAYFGVTSALSAGVMGMPFVGTALFLAGLFRDPDDERGDAKTNLRNIIFDMAGDKDLADVVAKGLPALFGADLSQRIGLGDLASPFPMAKINGKTGLDKTGESLAAVFGPSAGLAAQGFDAVAHFESGDWAKGVEKLVPKALADVIRAGRYTAQGMTDNKGEEILGPDEISAWNKFLRASGVASTQESSYYEGTAAKKDTQAAVADRKVRIEHQFTAALRDGDMASVREKIEAFNADHPAMPIKAKDEVSWRKNARRSDAQRDDVTGIKFDPKRDRNYADTMRFAR